MYESSRYLWDCCNPLLCRESWSEDKGRDAVLSCVRSYRKRMKQYSEMNVLDVWYASIDMERLLPMIHDKATAKRMKKPLEKARERSVLEHEFPELVITSGITPTTRWGTKDANITSVSLRI